MLATISPSSPMTSAERFALTAKQAGCPRDQIENFVRAGYVPQPMQLQFHAAAREADNPGGPDEIGLGGARGPGKSHGIFAQVALDDCQRRDELKFLYLRKVGKQAREQLEDLRRRVLRYVPHDYNRGTGVITFPKESRIVVGHFRNESDIENYLGMEYDGIAIEETTTLSQSKYKTLRDSNRTSREDWRPRIYNSTNPGGIGHAWYKARFITPYKRHTELYTRFVPGTIDDNRFIDPDYRRKLEENVGWKLQAYRYGDWEIAAGQFFTNWREDIHVVKPFPILSASKRIWAAMDYGFSHWNAVYLFMETYDGAIYVCDEYAQRKTLVPEHVRNIKDMLSRNKLGIGHLETFVAGPDVFAERGVELTIAQQYRREGIELKPAVTNRVNGAAEILKRLGDIDKSIPPSLFVFGTCQRLIECIPAMEHDPNRPEDVLKVDIDEDGNGGDDPYDAMRYGLMEAQARVQYGENPMAGYRG